MKKTPKPITRRKKGSKTKTPKNKGVVAKLQAFYGFTYFDSYAMTEPVAEALTEDLFNWACKNKDDALTFEEFAQERGIPVRMMYPWMKKFPVLKKAYEDAKAFIGNNREIGALKRKLSERTVLRSLPQYSKRWKESEEWWASLTKQEKNALEKYIFEIRELKSNKEEEEKL